MDTKIRLNNKKIIFFLALIIAILFHNPTAILSDQHIPPQEQEPSQPETIEFPSPKQIPSTQDTVEFPTKIEVPQKLPSTLDLKDIPIETQAPTGTKIKEPIKVPNINFPTDRFTPKTPVAPLVYQVVVSDCVTKQPLQGADVELKFLGNKQNIRSNVEGIAKFIELPQEGIEAGDVEVKKQGYKKAEISTSIFASKTDKICVSKDLVVIKPSDPPVIVSGPKEPIPIPTSTQPPVVSQPTDTSQTPTLTPVPPGTYEQPPVAQTPKEKKLPPNKPKKGKPPVDIDRQTETTSGRSEELIYEGENYPETVVGDPVANQIETDEKLSTVARLLKDKRSSQTTDNKDDDLIITKGGESTTHGGDNVWREEPLRRQLLRKWHTWEEITLAIYQDDVDSNAGERWAENVASRDGIEAFGINGVNSLINELRSLKFHCKCVKYMVFNVHGSYAKFRIGPYDAGPRVRVGYHPDQRRPRDFGRWIEPYLCRHPRIRLFSCWTAGRGGGLPREDGPRFLQELADASGATVTAYSKRCSGEPDGTDEWSFMEGGSMWQATPEGQQPEQVDELLGPDWVPGNFSVE